MQRETKFFSLLKRTFFFIAHTLEMNESMQAMGSVSPSARLCPEFNETMRADTKLLMHFLFH